MRVDNPTAAPVNIQEFGPGDSTWVMPDGARLVQVSVIAGGGGGTSGMRRTPSVPIPGSGADPGTPGDAPGGLSGEGGGWAILTFPASTLTAEVPITVGLGGVGDDGATTDGEYGAGATDGGATTFGQYLTVAGGRYASRSETRPVVPSMIAPGGSTAPDSAGCPAGGNGGSIEALINEGDTPVITPAGQGGRSTLTGNAAATPGVTGGVINGGDGASSTANQPMPGNAGAGGAASLSGPGGDGGSGGNYGTGGGGGGASTDGYPSGGGGAGGDGICTVVTYF